MTPKSHVKYSAIRKANTHRQVGLQASDVQGSSWSSQREIFNDKMFACSELTVTRDLACAWTASCSRKMTIQQSYKTKIQQCQDKPLEIQFVM